MHKVDETTSQPHVTWESKTVCDGRCRISVEIDFIKFIGLFYRKTYNTTPSCMLITQQNPSSLLPFSVFAML